MQQAINEPATSIVSKAAREIVSQRQRGEDSSLLLWVNKPDKSHPCQMTISGNSKVRDIRRLFDKFNGLFITSLYCAWQFRPTVVSLRAALRIAQ